MDRITSILSEFATKDIIEKHIFYTGKRKGIIIFNPDLYDSLVVSECLKAMQHFYTREATLDEIVEKLLYCAEVKIERDKDKVMESLLAGESILAIDGIENFIVINTRKYDKRAVAEPPTETVMRGPREGFIEEIKTNLALIRKRARTPALAIERFKVGRISSTDVALVYLSTIADGKLVEQIRERIRQVDIDALLDSYTLQPYLETHPYSIFKQAGATEKPDIVMAKLLEGRIAIFVDGSPLVLTIPFLLIEELQSSEDYYERHSFATFLRVVRYLSVILAIILPGFYVAIQVFHHSIIPVRFLITLQNAVTGIPLSPLPEVLFVTLLFEIIREAGLRMPRAVGMALSIVGALVLGETAVKAGLISSPAVMITALSSIAIYTVPNEIGSISILRIVFTVLGGFLGLFGLFIGIIMLAHYLISFDSFGAPYLAPLAPLIGPDLKDAIGKKPIFDMKERPQSLSNKNKTRQGDYGKNN